MSNDEIRPLDSPVAAVPIPPPTSPRSVLRKAFVGPHGLRAGWKVLLFFLIVFAVGFCLRPVGKLSGKIDPKLPVPPGPMLFREFLRAITVLVATGIMARFIDRKPWGYFGMPVRNAFRPTFWIGAVIGVGLLALQLEVMHLFGWFDFGTVQLNGRSIVTYGMLWALMFLCVGISEEGVLRGYVQRVTTDGLSMLPGTSSFWDFCGSFLNHFCGTTSRESRRKQMRHHHGVHRRDGHVLQPVAHG
jgi:uncharacterized protein